MKIIKIIKDKFNKNETVVTLPYKPGDPEHEYPKFGHGVWRHYNPELFHLTDDEIDTLLKENSDMIDAGRHRDEAWEVLYEEAEDGLKERMDKIYKAVEENNQW